MGATLWNELPRNLETIKNGKSRDICNILQKPQNEDKQSRKQNTET